MRLLNQLSAAPTAPHFVVTITAEAKSVFTLEEAADTFEALAEQFTAYEIGPKGTNGAIIPARFEPCPVGRCNGSGKDCGGGRPHRLSANVRSMTMLGLDYDTLTAAGMERVIESLKARGVAFFYWSTHGYTPERPKCRIMIPFAVPMPIGGKRQWGDVAWPALVRHLELPPCDSSCSNSDRLYFLPEKPDENAVRPAGAFTGELFDWRPIVGAALERVRVAAVEHVEAQKPDPTRPVDFEPLRARLRRITKPSMTPPLITKVLKGEAPTPPPATRQPGELSRREAWKRVTVSLANVAEGWEESESLLEILRPAWRAEVAESPDDHTEWETIEELFEGARGNAASYRAQKKAADAEKFRGWREYMRKVAGGR